MQARCESCEGSVAEPESFPKTPEHREMRTGTVLVDYSSSRAAPAMSRGVQPIQPTEWRVRSAAEVV